MAGTRSLHVESPYVRRARRPEAQHRLFCFPHAGAGVSAYAEWAAELPAGIEVVAIQLPGREDRSTEAPFTQAEPLIRHLVLALRPYLRGSFSFFGHSGGALLAFELARALQRGRRAVPVHLFVSGQDAPDAPAVTEPLHALPESDFRAAVEGIGGLAPGVVSDEGLMEMLLPTLRADFQLWETYKYQPGVPLAGSVTTLAGRDDERVSTAGQESWRGHTEGEFKSHLFDGGHFYLNSQREELLATLGGIVLGGTDSDGTAGK